jgi:hypothetical protein
MPIQDDPNDAAGGDAQGQEDSLDGFDFDGWLSSQPEAIQAGVSGHIRGLKNTVEATRGEVKQLREQRESIEKLSAQAEGELKTQLDSLSGKLQEREREVAFTNESVAQGVTNPHALWVLAREAEAFDRYGKPDWTHLRQTYGEFFAGAPKPRGNAGAGTGSTPPVGQGMEDLLRKAAGRG